MDLPRIWKTLVCIAASISMVLCTVSMQVAASPAGDGRGPITVVDQGPPIPTDPDAEPDAPYSPGEMMELGITDVTALEPMVLATYPSYTSSQIAKDDGGMWYVIATRAYLNKWVIVDGNYRYYDGGILQTGWKQLPATNEADAGVFWFYLGADGNMRTGWIYVSEDDVYYYLKPSTGIMAAAEWVKVNGFWYYFKSDGVMEDCGWFTLSGVTYYLYPTQTTANGNTYPRGSMAIAGHYLPRPETGKQDEKRNYYFAGNGAKQEWSYPLDASVSANVLLTNAFKEGGHNGIDIASSYGAPVYSSIGGKVVYCAKQASMGNCVIERTSIIDTNGTPLTVRYMHMSQLYVERVSSSVGINSTIYTTKGQKIGEVGNTGTVYPKPTTENPYAGTHLHIDVNPYDLWNADVSASQQYNPAAFFTTITFSPNGSTPFGSTLN